MPNIVDLHGFQQNAIWIAVHDALDRAVRQIADGIAAFFRHVNQFGSIRHELSGDRIVGIVPVDQPCHGGRDCDGVPQRHLIQLNGLTGTDQPHCFKLFHCFERNRFW